MKVTYIKHSGFCVEWENCVWIFDYWQGEIPVFSKEKRLIVFVSHRHENHFNPEIFNMFTDYPDVTYILSADIRYPVKNIQQKIIYLKAYERYTEERLNVKTLHSTDCGVAFLVEYEGKFVYHAGDLNWWVWKEESKQEYNDMTARFKREIAKLKEWAPHIDVAFIPLDPRQEEWYRLGMDYFLDQIDVGLIVPMHFWEDYEVVERYRESLNEDLKRRFL